MKDLRALIVAFVLLTSVILVLSYVGCYFALVQPDALITHSPYQLGASNVHHQTGLDVDWRTVEHLYWPVEQADRRVRPGAWRMRNEWQEHLRKAFEQVK